MDLSGMGGMGGDDMGGHDSAPPKPDINSIIAQLQDVLGQLQAYAGDENQEPDEAGGDMGDSLSPLGGKAMPSMRKGPLYGA